MTMHDKIMALEPIGCKSQVSALQFTNAKMRASQIAHEGDELMAEMASVLVGNQTTYGIEVLQKYYRWRDGE